MDDRERIMVEMAAADAIRQSSEARIAGIGETVRSDIYDKLIHQGWFGQYPAQYADDLYQRADQAQDEQMPEPQSPETSMEALYGAPQQEVREQQPPAPEREMER